MCCYCSKIVSELDLSNMLILKEVGSGRHPLDDKTDPLLCVSDGFLFLLPHHSVTVGSKSKCHKNQSLSRERAAFPPSSY